MAFRFVHTADVTGMGHTPDVDPVELLLPAATLGPLHALIERRSALMERRDAMHREHETACDQVRQAGEAVEALGVAANVSALEATLSSIRSRELGAQLEHARQRHAELTAEIEADLIGLQPWHGDVEALAALILPERGATDRWKSGLAEACEEQAALSRRESETAEADARLIAEIRTVKANTGAVDDEQAAAARSSRDRAWQTHRNRLNAGTIEPGPIDTQALQSTADAFEAAMVENDRLVDLRIRQSTDVARLQNAGEEIARLEASLAHVREHLEAASTRQRELTGAISTALRAVGLPGDMEPVDLERWCEQRDAVLRKRTRLKEAETKLRELRDAEAEARTGLIGALADFEAASDRNLPLSHLLDLAQGAVSRARERGAAVAAARKAHESGELELRRRKRGAAEANRAVLAWQEEWSVLLGRCWLGAEGVQRSPDEVRDILRTLSELPALIEKRDDLGRRIRDTSDDRARFLATVRRLAAKAALTFEDEKVLDVGYELNRRLDDALQETKLRDSKKDDRERAQSQLRKARQAMTRIDARVAEMGAREAFRTMTRGAFSDLKTTPGRDGDVLVGIQSNGRSLIASAMSKGARYQLYLALRIAGYHEFAAHHETLPFVADDIMEAFDDDRSAEAFQLLSGIAEKGQVIYLTHHPHMRDIARKVCGERVQVHELPAPMSTTSE